MLFLLALASAADRVEEADTLAMGRTSVAAPHSNSMLSANPGGMGLTNRYTFNIGFAYGARGIHWQVGAIDTQTSKVAFGVSYSGDIFHPAITAAELPAYQIPGSTISNRKRYHDATLGLAIPLADRRISIGIGGRISYFNTDRRGKGVTGNMHAGAAFRPHDSVTIGLSARNVLPIDDPGLTAPLELLGGLTIGDRQIGGLQLEGGLRPEFEGGLDDQLVLGVGGELLPRSAAFRSGWRYENGLNHVSVGIGGGTEAARLDLGLLVPTNALIKPRDWTAGLTIRFKGPNMEEIRPR